MPTSSMISIPRSRTNMHVRSEFVYTLPAPKAVETRRAAILQCLERNEHENGYSKQHSGYGLQISGSDSKRNHFSDIYDEVDPAYSSDLAKTVPNTFPIKRLYHVCNTFESSARKQRTGQIRSNLHPRNKEDDLRGSFPYVDDKATVLGELNNAEILRTRHRVNSHSHPRWAIRTIRQRRRKVLLRLKRRSISQERIRSLQAELISSKPTVSS